MADSIDDIDILRQWLGGMGRDLSLPMPRLSAESIAVLKRLMEASKDRDRIVLRLASETHRQSQAWLDSAEEDAEILQGCGISLTNVTASLRTSLETLSSSAVALGTTNASQATLNGAVLELDRAAAENEVSADGQDILLPALKREHEVTKARLEELQSFEADAARMMTCDDMEKRRRADSIRYLNLKAKQYEESIVQLKDELKRVGVSDKIYHNRLVQESEQAKALQEQLEPMREKLAKFRELPPDVRQARMHVDEDRARLQELEAELQESIKDMVVGT